MAPLELSKEAETMLRTLMECLNFENENAVVDDLFYQFVLNQEPDKKRIIKSIYQMNIKGATKGSQRPLLRSIFNKKRRSKKPI